MQALIAFGVVLLIGVGAAAAWLERPRTQMVWTAEADGFEHSYFRGEHSPVYVRRQLLADGCVFGDYPEGEPPTATRVDCGATWRGLFGNELRCECQVKGR